jgi:hypothetical protein
MRYKSREGGELVPAGRPGVCCRLLLLTWGFWCHGVASRATYCRMRCCLSGFASRPSDLSRLKDPQKYYKKCEHAVELREKNRGIWQGKREIAPQAWTSHLRRRTPVLRIGATDLQQTSTSCASPYPSWLHGRLQELGDLMVGGELHPR